jgi:predicted nucleotidyltransferase
MTKEEINKVLFLNRETLKKYRVKSISLFGSYVRNEQKEESDIDFLVDFQEGATLFDFVELQDSLSELLAKKVSIVSRRGLSKYIGPYILKEAEPVGEGL